MRKQNRKRLPALLLTLSMLAALLAGCGAAPEKAAAATAAPSASASADETTEEEQLYAIVSPLGNNEVEQITMAPRLDTLDGKKIALVGGSFHAAETHAELKRCIEKDYPNAELFMFDAVGTAGTYNLFAVSNQVKRFQARLQELGIEAVITGNCG